MKLIHLPTGEIVTKHSKVKMKSILNSTIYIRAELPEHWRVEGYDKSWEWAQTDVAKHYDVTSDKRLCHASILFEGVEVITRAEFEYHIYNPWKEGQSKQDPFTPSALYNYMAENHNVTLLGSEESVIRDIVLNDIEAIKQQAEKMGKYAGTFGNENRIEDEPTPYIETSLSRASHYNQQPIEVIDMMLAVYGKEAVKHFCLLNSFKYRMRAGHKDDALQDIEKAKWYEAKAKEIDGTPAA